MIDVLEKIIDKEPNRIQFISVEDEKEYTLDDVDKLANQVARWGLKCGCKEKDTIALMMHSHPDFFTIWFGFGKIGVASALLNSGTTGKSLVHCVEVALKDSDTKIFIVDMSLKSHIIPDIAAIEALGISVYFWDTSSKNVCADSIKTNLFDQPTSRLPANSHRSQVKASVDALIYIFTSGTTGLPKACKITHQRYHSGSCVPHLVCKMKSTDRFYSVLPLYHSAGGMLGLGGCLQSGATMVLRKKFSASNFASDCARHKCTMIQYIGELGRYLVNAPESIHEDHLRIRVAFGNGMRPEYWEKFQKRYHVEHVVEFYAATEGNVFLFNDRDKVGALGYVPPGAQWMYPNFIIKTEEEDKSKPWRDPSTGRCVQSKPNEPGLLISPVLKNRVFDGYTSKTDTEKKMLHGIFNESDTFFNTGDLLTVDAEGYYYWSDRAGDTFRWKGENVATTEITAALSSLPSVKDVNVVGVTVPHCDGRAGLAMISLGDGSNLDIDSFCHDLHTLCKQDLPAYARPLFLRLQSDDGEGSATDGTNGKPAKTLQATVTFKHVKGDIVKQGFDPALVGGDALYYFDAKANKYKDITTEAFAEITRGAIRF